MATETVTYSSATWPQEERNLIVAGAAALLFAAGVAHGPLRRSGASAAHAIEVDDPVPANVATVLSEANYRAWYTAQAAALATAATATAAAEAARAAELTANALRDVTLAQVEARMDTIASAWAAASNLAQAKAALTDALVLLRQLVRLCVAKKITGDKA